MVGPQVDDFPCGFRVRDREGTSGLRLTDCGFLRRSAPRKIKGTNDTVTQQGLPGYEDMRATRKWIVDAMDLLAASRYQPVHHLNVLIYVYVPAHRKTRVPDGARRKEGRTRRRGSNETGPGNNEIGSMHRSLEEALSGRGCQGDGRRS